MSKDKQSIQVTIRVRPLSEKQKQEDNRICVDVQEHTHSIQTFYGNQSKKFTFDSICDNNSQDDLFQKVGKKSTVYCLEGYNSTIFAYGQTGSGKTFTMMGVDPAHQNYDNLRGLIPRTLQYLFESIDLQIKETSSEYIIRCSFLQIYNQQIIDLLNPRNNNNLQVREDIKKGVYVQGITEQTIFKGDQAMDILKKGSKGRHVGSTCYNETSSRSHSVFTMQIQSKHTKNGVVNTKIRYFHFIDLAGSQRTKQINGDRLKQGCSINKSLHVLGKVINSLAQSTQLKPRHINYRDSKLTFLLKDSLGGNSKTHLIANISPCTMSYSQTNMTLAFARRVKLIKVNKASINEDMSGNLESLKSEIKRLKQEIISLRNGSMSTILTTSMLPKLDSSDSLQQYTTLLSPVKDTQQQHETKILTMLNQYVSDQLDKQTKFSLQINKLYKKIQCLQQAIKKYSQNEMHFKLIINVYQDKVARMKTGEELLTARVVDELNAENDQEEKIKEYFQLQREELVKEVNQYKMIVSENCNILLGLLKSCRAYNVESSKQSQYKQEFLTLLKTNTQFLTSLSSQVQQILHSSSQPQPFPSTLQSDLTTIDKVIQQRLALVQLQYSKKQSELMQRIEQMGLQIGEVKNMNEDNQMLLREAVDREISLEESVKDKERVIEQLEQRNKGLVKKEEELVGQVSKAVKAIDEMTKENVRLRQQLQQQCTSYRQLQQSHSSTIQQMHQLQQQLTQSTQQTTSFKSRSLQLQAQLNDNTISYQQRTTILQQRLHQSQKQLTQTQGKLLQYKQQLKVNQAEYQQMQVNKKIQMEQFTSMVNELEHRLSRQEKELGLASEVREKLEVKSKALQEKIVVITQQLQRSLQHTDRLTLQLTHSKHQSQHYNTKLTHLESLLHQKSLNQLQLQQKLKQKQHQLIQAINQFQSSTDSSCQQINKVKIENLQLRQCRSQLELKVNKLAECIKQKELNLDVRGNKIQQIKQELEQKSHKLNAQKQLTTQNKQTIRHLNYLIEQHRLLISNKQLLISQKDEEFEEIHAKNITLLQQITTLKSQSTEHVLKLKQLQNQLYCVEKANQIEKETVVKQHQKKMSKLNQMLNERNVQIKSNVKIINQLRVKLTSVQTELLKVKQMSHKAEQGLKLLIQKQILNRSLQTTQLKQHIAILNEKHTYQQQQSSTKISQLQQTNTNIHMLFTQLTSKHELQQIQNTKLATIIQQQQTHITELQQKIQQLKNMHDGELMDLQQQHNHQIDSKNEEIELKNQQLILMGQQLQMKSLQLEQRNKQIACKNGEIQSLTLSLNMKHNQIQSLNQQLINSNSQLQSLKQLVNIKDNTINEQLTQLQMKNQILQQTNKQIQANRITINQNMLCLEQKNREIRQMKDALMDKELYIGEMQQIKKQIEINRVTIQELSNHLEDKQCQVEMNNLQLQRHKTMSEQRIKQLQQQINQLQIQLQQVSTQLHDHMNTRQHNQQVIRTLTAQNKQMKNIISGKQSELSALRNQLSEESNALVQQLNWLKQQIQEKTNLLQQVHGELEELGLEKDNLQRNYQEKVRRSVGQRESVNRKVEQLQVQLKQVLQTQLLKEAQLQHLQHQLQQTNKQLQQTTQKLQQKTQQLQQITQQLQETSQQLQQTTQQLQQTTQSNQQKSTIISQLNTQLYQLQNSLTHLQQSHTSISQQLHTVTHIKDTQQEQLRKTVSEIHHLENQLEEKARLKYLAQNELQQVEKRWSCQMDSLNVQLNETIKQLQLAKQSLKQQTHALKQQLHELTQQLARQTQSHKTILNQKLSQHQQQSQSLQLAITHLTQQKAQQLQSYRSLQQINKGLGRKCEQYVTSLQQQKSEYRKLQTKYLGERNINQNLKQLIQNNQQQKKRLSIQLREKTQSYSKLLQKIKSQQYQQVMMMNNRQNNQFIQMKAKNQELKRVVVGKTQLLEKKEVEMKELARKSQQYSKNIQLRVKEFETDYMQLEAKYEQLLQSKKHYEAMQQDNLTLRQQLQQSRPKLQRMTLKIQQLQQRIRSINQQYIQLQQQNHQIKKKILYPSSNDQKVSMYLNKLKSEINDLKKEKQILQQTIKKQTAEKMRLKTELIKTNSINNNNNSINTTTLANKHNSVENNNINKSDQLSSLNATKLELQRKLTEIRYLQQIIAEMIDILKIKQFEHGNNPKSIKIESIRKGIVTNIKEKIQQNKLLKEKLIEMENKFILREKENKVNSSVNYNGVGSATKKQPSSSISIIPSSHVTMAKTEKRDKTFSLKQQNQSSQNIKNRLNSTPNSQQCSQQKKQRRGLQIGDNVRTMMDATEEMHYNVREKMRVKEIIGNHNGKYYRNMQ